MHKQPTEVPYGTLDLMILRTLDSMGPQHGYGIARRIEQSTQGALALNQGTIYPALVRIEQRGWTRGSWGKTENGREAKYYAITDHSMAPEMLLMSKKIYDGLTPDEQKIIRDAAKASVPYMRKLWDEKELESRTVPGSE